MESKEVKELKKLQKRLKRLKRRQLDFLKSCSVLPRPLDLSKQDLPSRMTPLAQLQLAAIRHYDAAVAYRAAVGTPLVREKEKEERVSYEALWKAIEDFYADYYKLPLGNKRGS